MFELFVLDYVSLSIFELCSNFELWCLNLFNVVELWCLNLFNMVELWLVAIFMFELSYCEV